MATQRQINANRKNGLSGGVKTPSGKAIISHNAIKHGLTSGMAVLPSESLEEYLSLCDRLASELSPVGELEKFWTERVAKLMWRLKRCDHAEAGILFRRLLNVQINDAENEWSRIIRAEDRSHSPQYSQLERLHHHPELVVGNLLRLENEFLYRFGEYETGIQKRLSRAIRELEYLQDRRRSLTQKPVISEAQNVNKS